MIPPLRDFHAGFALMSIISMEETFVKWRNDAWTKF